MADLDESASIKIDFLSNIQEIKPKDWNRLNPNNYPFTQYEFLAALESSHCVGANTGWQAKHMVLYRGEQLVAAMPCYRKDHSYGEYVFDWSWAQAYQEQGLNYYPKLISAIPFTPVPGTRLLCDEQTKYKPLIRAIFEAIQKYSEDNGYSGWHLLFPEIDLLKQGTDLGLLKREDIQFHWHNQNYQEFDDFLAILRSSKRKQVRRERRIVADQDVEMRRYCGKQIDSWVLESFYICYCQTYLRRSGHSGYLNQKFFEEITNSLSEQMMICLAIKEDRAIAASLFFFDEDNLYGRYWGCIENIDCLHFEACYYQGIEFAIERKIKSFNPGTQGEHKLVRGFEPTKTFSLHWVKDSRFQAALANFMRQESEYKTEYQDAAKEALPFRQNEN